MQYFGCCPTGEGNDTIETTLTTQQFSPRYALNTTPTNRTYNRRHPIESSPTLSLNGTSCNAPVDPYRVLELRRDATPSEIIGSYRKLALIYHPGRKISCPLERKKRMQFFEVLAACYETLMHSEFRRRCDILLKDMEKKQNRKNNRQMITRQPQQLQSKSLAIIKDTDSIPGLIPSQSSSASGDEKNKKYVGNSAESNETVQRNNCSSIGGILTCAAGSRALYISSSSNKSFTISRDGTKGFKSLADSSSLSASQSQGSTEEDGEIHFSEATVNRLFGGPLASLHRARNFQAFSDPYLVFDKVFGNQKPIFPHVRLADIHATADETVENFHKNGTMNSLIRSSSLQFGNSGVETFSVSRKNENKSTNNALGAKNSNDLTANTKVFVSSRVVNGRKITKTETVHVDPETGVASVNVTVDGEDLEPVKSKKKSSPIYGSSVADWLLCFGTAKVSPATKSTTTASKDLPSSKPSICCPKKQYDGHNEDQLSASCGFKSIYVEALEEFYLCNDNFYEECNRYMRCGGGNPIS